MVDVARVESDVTAGKLRGDVGPVEHTSTSAATAARSSRVPRMCRAMRPRLRATEQTSELVVHVTGSKYVVSAAACAMRFRRQVSQNSIDGRNLTAVDNLIIIRKIKI